VSNDVRTVQASGLLACGTCALLMQARPVGLRDGEVAACARCHSPLYSRKAQSLQRTGAFLITAAILYVPANVLPIMHTGTLVHEEDDTILSGVLALWDSGSWPLAVLVFCVSIVIPILKLSSLGLLMLCAHRGSQWRLRERATLFRVIEGVGRWSMLDVFVVALLVSLVQLHGVANILPKPGAVAFAAVVVLTMLAAKSFDPRLMWDRGQV
jgi:paraquat-inducible protein A